MINELLLTLKRFGLSCLISCLCLTATQANDERDVDWLKSNVLTANKHIVPRYKALARSTARLSSSVVELCASESDVVLSTKVRKRFRSAYLDWAEIQHIKFGPVSFLKRLERIEYWPDKHNSSGRQVRNLLQVTDNGITFTPAQFEKKSVAIQGFTALERMLFPKNGIITPSHCTLAQNITLNLDSIATVLDENWRLSPVEYANEFALADRDSGTYSSSDEVATILANALATQLLVIAEYKLGRALPKEEGGRTYERQMEAWRSELSMDMMIASLKSLHALHKRAFRPQLVRRNKVLNQQIEQQFSALVTIAKKIRKPMIKLIKSDDGIAQIKDLKQRVERLEALVRNDLFSELGFAARFNSLDGD